MHICQRERGIKLAIQIFKRRERKYLLEEAVFEEMKERLLEHMYLDGHSGSKRGYYIYNVYYDTDQDELIRHSISSPYYKEKLRLRSYSEISSSDEHVYMEIKKKIGGVVSKRRISLKLRDAELFIGQGKLPRAEDCMDRQIVDEIAYLLKRHSLKPKVFIGYERVAYFGREDSNLRVTFDSRIATRRKELDLSISDCDELLIPDGKRLMEVKFSDSSPLWLSKMLSELEVYNTKFSKYGNEFKRYCNKSTRNLERM